MIQLSRLCFLIFSLILAYQIEGKTEINIDSLKLKPWLGTWAGVLVILNHEGVQQKVPMKIKHFRTDTAGTYGWYLIYGEDEENGTREYFLKEKDPSMGHYIVDEKNGIYLDSYLIGNKMISNFEVMNSDIQSIYTLLENGNMEFEIIFSRKDQNQVSGNIKMGDQEVPEVISYSVGGYQNAILKKIDD